MTSKSLVTAFCCAALLNSLIGGLTSGSAAAAMLQPGQGDLTINQGQGFRPVNSRVDAHVGDAVMVGPDGSATVVYDDGCKVDVQPGAVMTITPLSPCASGSYAFDPDYGSLLLAGGAAGLVGWGIYNATQTSSSNGVAPASP